MGRSPLRGEETDTHTHTGSFAAEFEQESQASSCVEEWNSACLSSCSRGDRPLVELCVEPAGLCGRPLDPGPLPLWPQLLQLSLITVLQNPWLSVP